MTKPLFSDALSTRVSEIDAQPGSASDKLVLHLCAAVDETVAAALSLPEAERGKALRELHLHQTAAALGL